MKIFQLILSNQPSADLRYADELYNTIKIYFPEHDIVNHIINHNEILNTSTINLISTYDYLFVYGLNNNKEQYIQLYKFINIPKIIFITNQNFNKFVSSINLEYVKNLFSSCNKIVLNMNDVKLTNFLSKFVNPENFIQLNYIYNFDNTNINNIVKNKEIIQISNKGLNSKYDLFINMFKNKTNYLNNFIWKIYGVTKNIQTLSVDDLYLNIKTNQPSKITNFNTDIIDEEKINIYPTINNDQIKEIINKSYFVCYFDKSDFINYTLLDIIYNGAIPIIDYEYAKNIFVNRKQTLYDVINGIYVNYNKNMIDQNALINMSKYVQSTNTYKSIVLKNIKICDQLFNPKTNIKTLLEKI